MYYTLVGEDKIQELVSSLELSTTVYRHYSLFILGGTHSY
jgi:hypothetical protein